MVALKGRVFLSSHSASIKLPSGRNEVRIPKAGNLMMFDPLLTGYATVFILYAVTFFSSFMGWKGLSRLLSVMALAVNGSILVGILIESGQPPVFEMFGGMLFVMFILCLLGIFCCRAEEGRLNIKTWVWIEILFLLGITLFFPTDLLPHRYHHTYPWVVLFHGFRCLALSLALFSAAHFVRFRREPLRKRVNNPLFKQGRNYLLLSAVTFLCGEYSGIIWCQNGWGDFWHWSPAFFQSTLIILFFMAAFHLPGKNPRSDNLRSVIAIMTPLLMLTIKVVKGLS